MNIPVYYSTVKEALDLLKSKGFTTDFNLGENCIVCNSGKFNHNEFEIIEVYRYEGESNPDDEATVYGIESKSGLKGVLVTSYGAYSDNMSDELLQKLSFRN